MEADRTALLAAPAGSGRLAASTRRGAGLLAVFAVLFLVWEYAVWLLGVKAYLLPPPSTI